MATVNLTFGTVAADHGPIRPPLLNITSAEDITPSGTSMQSTASGGAAQWGQPQVVRIVVSGANIRLKIGPNPTAVNTGDTLMLDGATEDFFLKLDDKVAVVTSAAL